MRRAIASVLIASIFLSSCAASQQQFITNGHALDDVKVCRNYLKDKDKTLIGYSPSDDTERSYVTSLRSQIKRRNLSETRCQALVEEEDKKIGAGVMLGVLAVGAAVMLSKNGGGGGGSSYSGSSFYDDDDYAWDQFRNGYGGLTWRCRNKQNGQFASNYLCAGKPKTDHTWPTRYGW